MENVNNNIADLLTELVQPFNFTFRKRLLSHVQENESYLSTWYKKEAVDEKHLLCFFKACLLSERIRHLVPSILYLIEPQSITDKVVQFCIHYPGKFRSTLLSQLAHMWLSTSQLELINENIPTLEAFCKLLIIYTSNNLHSPETLESFLLSNSQSLEKINIQEILKINNVQIADNKLCILNRFYKPNCSLDNDPN